MVCSSPDSYFLFDLVKVSSVSSVCCSKMGLASCCRQRQDYRVLTAISGTFDNGPTGGHPTVG